MLNSQRVYWENYKKEIIDSVNVLIEKGHYNAAAKLILLGIDSVAGFYMGRVENGFITKSFSGFVEKYMWKFNDVNFPTKGVVLINRKTGYRFNKPSEVLYHVIRNGFIHDGFVGIGIEIYKDLDSRVLWSGSGFNIFRLNIVGFFEYFKISLVNYENDLNTDTVLMQKFVNKYNDINFFSFGSLKTKKA